MEHQLYIRIRGRVLGPYDQEKLQSLARRGQLSRMHELSKDATNWVRASTYPELFVSETPPPPGVATGGPGEFPDSYNLGRQAQRSSGQLWWYNRNGSEAGPVDQATLQQMLASGTLSPDDIVWTDGMAQWTPARQAPGLLPLPAAPTIQPQGGGPVAGPTEQEGELSPSLCKSASNSRPWVVFIAVIAFIHAGLLLLFGILLLIQGANQHVAPVVALGLYGLIYAVDVAAGAFLLSAYANRIASLRYSSHPMVLEKSLETLHTFWVYVSINLIVLLASLVSLIVWVIAASGTFPWF